MNRLQLNWIAELPKGDVYEIRSDLSALDMKDLFTTVCANLPNSEEFLKSNSEEQLHNAAQQLRRIADYAEYTRKSCWVWFGEGNESPIFDHKFEDRSSYCRVRLTNKSDGSFDIWHVTDNELYYHILFISESLPMKYDEVKDGRIEGQMEKFGYVLYHVDGVIVDREGNKSDARFSIRIDKQHSPELIPIVREGNKLEVQLSVRIDEPPSPELIPIARLPKMLNNESIQVHEIVTI